MLKGRDSYTAERASTKINKEGRKEREDIRGKKKEEKTPFGTHLSFVVLDAFTDFKFSYVEVATF